MKKRVLAAMLAAVMVVAVAAGCGKSSDSEGTTGETSSDGKEVENGDKKISTIKLLEGVSVGAKIKLTDDTKIKILPSANSSNIAELQANTEVTIIEVINRWCRIEAGDNIGWVRIDQ